MSKEDVLTKLRSIEDSSKNLIEELQQIKSDFVDRNSIKTLAHEVCSKWFEEVEPALSRFGVPDELVKKYHDLFTSLLQLALKKSRKASYLRIVDEVTNNFKIDLLVTVMKSAGQIISITHLSKILENAAEEERDYLNEALGCAGHGFLRASIVLGWSAAVHRMHKMIEKLGFDEFRKKSEEMKNITEGRFRRFNKTFTVNSLSELEATVFDKDMLWVLEYWGLIDANQHERLSICFTMRNNSAHPGEAPITEENLASLYSDLKSIVFDNPKLKL